jgi:hypothetical protein
MKMTTTPTRARIQATDNGWAFFFSPPRVSRQGGIPSPSTLRSPLVFLLLILSLRMSLPDAFALVAVAVATVASAASETVAPLQDEGYWATARRERSVIPPPPVHFAPLKPHQQPRKVAFAKPASSRKASGGRAIQQPSKVFTRTRNVPCSHH